MSTQWYGACFEGSNFNFLVSQMAPSREQAHSHEKWHRGLMYVCQLCGIKYSKPTSYWTHIRKHHPAHFVCTLCGDNCVSQNGLRMHIAKTHSRTQISEESPESASERFCADCNIQFMTKNAWTRHILTATVHKQALERINSSKDGATSLQCKICQAALSTIVELKVHMRDHERALGRGSTRHIYRKQSVTCEQCGGVFCNETKLLVHVKRAHMGIKYNSDIICEVCGKKCTCMATLIVHQRTHTGERPHKCDTCNKGFANINQLKVHVRIHTGERPYSCTMCEKRFAQKAALNRHSRVHTGAKPYVCQFCGKTFTQSNSMKLHVKCVHLKQKQKRLSRATSGKRTIAGDMNREVAQEEIARRE